MIPDQEPPGWVWFESSPELSTEQVELCRAFARCFSSQEGQMAIDHLTKLILERRLPAGCSNAELRHLEGQRFAIAYIVSMIERGRA